MNNLIKKLQQADWTKLRAIIININRAAMDAKEFDKSNFFTAIESMLDGSVETLKYEGKCI